MISEMFKRYIAEVGATIGDGLPEGFFGNVQFSFQDSKFVGANVLETIRPETENRKDGKKESGSRGA